MAWSAEEVPPEVVILMAAQTATRAKQGVAPAWLAGSDAVTTSCGRSYWWQSEVNYGQLQRLPWRPHRRKSARRSAVLLSIAALLAAAVFADSSILGGSATSRHSTGAATTLQAFLAPPGRRRMEPQAQEGPSPLTSALDGLVASGRLQGSAIGARASEGEVQPEKVPETLPKEEDMSLQDRFGSVATTVAVLFGSLLAASIIFSGFFVASVKDLPQGPAVKPNTDKAFEEYYMTIAEASKKADRLMTAANKAVEENLAPKPKTGKTLVPTLVVERIRGISSLLDNCQEDMYAECWVCLQSYPDILRSYLPIFDYYTETAYPPPEGLPEGEAAVAKELRFSLKYEVGRFGRGITNFATAVEERKIRDVERSFADISLAYDRYLKAGDLYAGYDPVASTTVFYEGIDDSQLQYLRTTLEQPRIRDEVLVIQGPDKGKVGRVIWLGRNEGAAKDDILTATVKLDPNPLLGGGIYGVKEVKAYPYSWIAVTRTKEQSFLLDLAFGSIAAAFSCAVTYPLDSIKSRVQSGISILPPEGVLGLFNGLSLNLLREVPNQGLYMALFNFLTRQLCELPFVDANNPSLKLLVMIPAGSISFFLPGSFFRAPFEILNKRIQTGQAKTDEEAVRQVFQDQPFDEVLATLKTTWVLCVVRGIPFGALQCTFYEFFKDNLELVSYGFPIALQPFVWGTLAGIFTGVLTNPPDVVLTRMATRDTRRPGHEGGGSGEEPDIFAAIVEASKRISTEEGPAGFMRGASARALYFAPEACLWFAAYEFLNYAWDVVNEI